MRPPRWALDVTFAACFILYSRLNASKIAYSEGSAEVLCHRFLGRGHKTSCQNTAARGAASGASFRIWLARIHLSPRTFDAPPAALTSSENDQKASWLKPRLSHRLNAPNRNERFHTISNGNIQRPKRHAKGFTDAIIAQLATAPNGSKLRLFRLY